MTVYRSTASRECGYTESDLCAPDTSRHGKAQVLLIGRSLDTIAPLDALLERCNTLLCEGGRLYCQAVPSACKQEQLREQMPWGLRSPAVGLHYLWHRVASKLWITRGFYRLLTGNCHRSMSRVEILGRIHRAGFTVTEQHIQNQILTLCATRCSVPSTERAHIGLIIGLPRIGQAGKKIRIYKVRTMYAYSEFLQETVYEQHRLSKEGKIARDYRINYLGHWLRAHWFDEWPMLYNLLRGDIKLVGVRPLSEHYYHLYSPEMQQRRIQTKPGLLPPLYAGRQTLNGLEEVQADERRYLDAYDQHPGKTDWHYFWRIVGNILFHRRRSS